MALGHTEIEGRENRYTQGTVPSICGNLKGTDTFRWKRVNHLINGFHINVYLEENISRLPFRTICRNTT